MYIGVDLGTSSVKAILMNEAGEILKSVSRDYPLLLPKPKYSEQNPEDWFNRTDEVLQELLIDIDEVKGISFSGQMHGLVVLDKDDNVIRPAILWNDQRTEAECDYLNNEIGKPFLIEKTGNIALTGFTAPKVLWIKNNEPENFAKISKAMLPKDYISYMLSGSFASDVSDSSGTLYFDCKNKCWSKEMLEILGINESQLPKVYESFEVVGELKDELVKKYGLKNTPKIIIGGGDQAVGAIGTGTVTDGSCSLALGTSGVMFVATDNCFVDDKFGIHSFAHASGKYHLMSVMLNAAGAVAWYFEKVLKRKDFDKITADIQNKEINNGLYFLPYLTGERTPINDPNAKGAFIGLTIQHDEADLFRAVLEGVAFAFRDSFEILKNLGVNIDRMRVTGGGAANETWVQIIANVLNVKIDYINTTEGGALGACLLASVGCGQFKTIEEATSEFIKVTKTISPVADDVAKYNDKYSKFTEVYPTIKKLF